MKILVAVSALVVAAVALAAGGTRIKETQGQVPNAVTDGIDIDSVTSCRAIARLGDGGTITGGTVQYYFNERYADGGYLGWTRANSAFDCAMQSGKLTDGGSGPIQICPAIETQPAVGRIAVVATGFLNTSGTAATPILRLQCWGPSLP